MIPLTIDTTDLSTALLEYVRLTGKSMPRLVNKKMARILSKAIWKTRKADYFKMMRSLDIRLRRTRAGTVKRGGRTFTFKQRWKAAGAAGSVDLPMIVAIIQSRVRRGGPSPYLGVPHRVGVKRMKKEIKRVVGARARSIGFMRSIFGSAFKPFRKYLGGGLPPSDSKAKPSKLTVKGWGTPATQATATASAQMRGFTRHGRGDWVLRYMQPALNAAYQEELRDFRQHVNRKLVEDAKQARLPARP